MDPIRLDVDTPSRRYTITLGDGVLDRLARLLDAADAPARRFVVSSPLIWRLHGSRLASAGLGEPILVPDGERFKQLQTVSRVYDALIRANADRASTLITFGGGVIGDMAGFAAATYLRGIALVHVPTTLLAQVDSAIGGKVGVNHALGKNLIGAFHQPHAVVVDPSVLATLPRREFRAGLYEVIKYGMTSSPACSTRSPTTAAVFARDPEVLAAVISESCRIKAAVVAADEREAGLRRILNFGHTAGHALEAVTKYRRYRHGEAVAYGMLVAAGAERGRAARWPTAIGRRWPISLPASALSRRSPTSPRVRSSTRCSTTRRSSPAGCTSCCRRPSARRRSWTMSRKRRSRPRWTRWDSGRELKSGRGPTRPFSIPKV